MPLVYTEWDVPLPLIDPTNYQKMALVVSQCQLVEVGCGWGGRVFWGGVLLCTCCSLVNGDSTQIYHTTCPLHYFDLNFIVN